jgi:cytochrome b6-f complex iron-sulfur subunit
VTAGAVIAVVVVAVVVLGGILFLTAARRADVRGAGALTRETRRSDRSAAEALPEAPTGREVEAAAAEARSAALVPAASAAPVPWVPPDPEVLAVTRRQFFNRASVSLMSASLAAFGAACVAFLWKGGGGGFGGKVSVGKIDEIITNIRANDGFFYVPEARTWLTEYPADAVSKAKSVYQPALLPGMEAGIVANYQKCPHLGCRVPDCKSSQWFECPCHGSQFNQVGEKKGGPAPRGMDHFAISVGTGNVVIDTGAVFTGAPIGTNTTGQEAEGPHCIGAGEGGH